ncbi:hypothetical protein [Bounagaea algeriensis]
MERPDGDGEQDGGPAPERLERLAERLTGHQVFGEPVVHGASTLVPVAAVRTGAGLGGGRKRGGGGGADVRPVGAFCLRSEGVTWHSAVNVNRVILGGQLAATVLGVAIALALRKRR